MNRIIHIEKTQQSTIYAVKTITLKYIHIFQHEYKLQVYICWGSLIQN